MGVFTEKDKNATITYVDNYVTTVSGDINNTIQNQTFIDLADTPNSYEDGMYLTSTVSGVEWSATGYANWDGGFAASNYGGIAGVDGGDASSF